MVTSISAVLIPCLKSFNWLQERVERPDYSCEGEVSSISWGDELGRLRVWAANIGAHQTGQSSLEFRLRDASHISKQITNLLQELDQSLNDVADELSEDGTKATDDGDTSTAWSDDNSTTELQQLHEEVVNIIDCLYQLSMLIRKPAQHDLLVGSRMSDKAEFEFYDKEHVRNLHPKTEEQISQRLGRAITRRRKYLNYRERHHRKLEKGIEEVQDIQRTTTGSSTSETIATDFKTHNIDFEETSSLSGMSQTSYAPSLTEGGRVTIPPPPRDSVGGKPFECPYCFFVIDIKSTRLWNRHIFKDIKPYVCTFTDCSMPDRLYDSRREWYFHETTEHHREDFVCALCKDTSKSSEQYERHVARHLEELALFALPRTEIDDAEDGDRDVFDATASTTAIGVAFDTAHGSDHSDLSTLQSVKDGEDVTGTGVQVGPRSDVESDEYSDNVEGEGDTWNVVFRDGGGPPESTSKPRTSNQQTPSGETPRPEGASPGKEKDKPIKFKDAIGRRFNFPFHLVNTWSGMEYMIKEAFLHVADLGLHVVDGEYDLIGPKDEVIMPSIWESVIEPGWEIKMHLWAIPEPQEGGGSLAGKMTDVVNVKPGLPLPPPDGKLLMIEKGGKNRKKKMPPSIIWGTGKSEMGAGTAEGNNREDLGTHKSEEEEYKEYKRELAEEMAEEKAFAQAARVRKRKLVKEKLEKKRRGGRAEAQPVNKVIGSSDSEETDEESIHSPFRKEVPSGPYHHYRGNRQD